MGGEVAFKFATNRGRVTCATTLIKVDDKGEMSFFFAISFQEEGASNCHQTEGTAPFIRATFVERKILSFTWYINFFK